MKKEEMEALEQKYEFASFSHEDAMKLAMVILKHYGEKYYPPDLPEGLGIRILIGNLLVFQYLMDKKDEDKWLRRKEKTVLHTGHSSLYAMLANEETGAYEEISRDPGYALCAGGFPLTINGVMRGCITVSGLPGMQDHDLLMLALEEFTKEN